MSDLKQVMKGMPYLIIGLTLIAFPWLLKLVVWVEKAYVRLRGEQS